MWAVNGQDLKMCEGDFGLILPVTISGATFSAQDEVKMTIKDGMNGETVIEKTFGNITGNTVKWLTVGKIPGLRLKATLTSIATAADEEADSHPFAISDIAFFYCTIIHCSLSQVQLFAQKGTGVRALAGCNLLRSARSNNGATTVSALGTKVNDIVRGLDKVEIVFNNNNGITTVGKSLKNADKL